MPLSTAFPLRFSLFQLTATPIRAKTIDFTTTYFDGFFTCLVVKGLLGWAY